MFINKTLRLNNLKCRRAMLKRSYIFYHISWYYHIYYIYIYIYIYNIIWSYISQMIYLVDLLHLYIKNHCVKELVIIISLKDLLISIATVRPQSKVFVILPFRHDRNKSIKWLVRNPTDTYVVSFVSLCFIITVNSETR